MVSKEYPKIMRNQEENTKRIHFPSNPVDAKGCVGSNARVSEPSRLGREILKARRARGMSQEAVARVLGVNAQTISNIETGRTQLLKLKFMANLHQLGIQPANYIDDVEEDEGGADEDLIDGDALGALKQYASRHQATLSEAIRRLLALADKVEAKAQNDLIAAELKYSEGKTAFDAAEQKRQREWDAKYGS
jgi:transcriptional regulator with XRE-family HTH domain